MACIGPETLEKSLMKIRRTQEKKEKKDQSIRYYPITYDFGTDWVNFEKNKLEKIAVSGYIKNSFDSVKPKTTEKFYQDITKYIEETGLIKYMDLLNTNKEYISLKRKQEKTQEDIEQIKKIEKSAIHGNRYLKFKNRKKLRALVDLVFNPHYEGENLTCLEISEYSKNKYEIRKDYLETGAKRIGKDFNEIALNDFVVNELLKEEKIKNYSKIMNSCFLIPRG